MVRASKQRVALEAALLDTRIPASAKLIMLTLMYAGRGSLNLGGRSPSTRELAGLTGLRLETVLKYTRLLEQHGWLSVSRQPGETSRYVLSAGRLFLAGEQPCPREVAEHAKRGNPAVYERDGWQCRMPRCFNPDGRDIDPAIQSPDPWSASVDHILPRSRGGLNRMANKRAAHRRCNILGFALLEGLDIP